MAIVHIVHYDSTAPWRPPYTASVRASRLQVLSRINAASAQLCSSVVAERVARTAAEAAVLEPVDDGELLELEGKFLNKKFATVGFEGRGAKRVVVEESFVVLKIYWEEQREVWFADCVEMCACGGKK